MNNPKETTIYDIAHKLQVSAATVSRGLKGDPSISKKTTHRINAMAELMGYRANHNARNLRTQKTKTIGVIIHEMHSTFITSVLAGIEKVTAEAGYDLIIAHSSESCKKEAANAKNLFDKRVDGLIASLSFDTTDLEHFKPFREKNVPLIFFDRVEQNENYPVVIIDNTSCGYQATKHLIEQGCKRIVHITSNLQRNVYAQRYKGYRDALFDSGLAFEENYLLINDLSENAGIESAMKVLAMKPLPDGLFITNDFVAAVCMQTLKANGIKIPDDIAIVGFNNDAIGKLIEPALTTIDYPGNNMGEIAARNVLNHLKGIADIQHSKVVIIKSDLIVRQSSLKKGLP